MSIKSVDVECDLADFSDYDIEEEYKYRGLGEGDESIYECWDEALIEECENRGFKVIEKEDYADLEKEITELYYDFIGTVSDEYLDKRLKEFFRKTIDRIL